MVGSSPVSFATLPCFHHTCMTTAWILAISTVSPVSTPSTLSPKWHQFRPQADTMLLTRKTKKHGIVENCRALLHVLYVSVLV